MESFLSTSNSLNLPPGSTGRQNILSQINLKNGDVITGKVIDIITPGKYVLRINGKDLIADTGFDLSKGKLYSLKVYKVAGQISFQLVDPIQSIKNPIEKISQFLKLNNFELSELNKNIALSMLKGKFPLSKANLISIINIFNGLDEKTKKELKSEEGIKSLFVLYDNKIEITKDNILNLKNIISRKNYTNSNNEISFENNLVSSESNITNIKSESNSFNSETLSKSLEIGFLLSNLINICPKDMELTDLFLRILKYHSLFNNSLNESKKINIINFDKIYYYDFSLNLGLKIVPMELFYQKLFVPHKLNKDEVLFNLNFLVYLDSAEPICLNLSKKVPEMIRMQISHPNKAKLKILENYKKDFRNILASVGYISTKVDFVLEDTTTSDFRYKLFITNKEINKNIDFVS